jgi:hypothetical protein
MASPIGWRPQDTLEHFATCAICGATFDMRDLSQVLEHVHGQEIKENQPALKGLQ